jgi:hypothetical protein
VPGYSCCGGPGSAPRRQRRLHEQAAILKAGLPVSYTARHSIATSSAPKKIARRFGNRPNFWKLRKSCCKDSFAGFEYFRESPNCPNCPTLNQKPDPMEPEDGLTQVQELFLEISQEMTDDEYRKFLHLVINESKERLDVL